MTQLTVELGDITTYRVDAVVNAANSSLMGGGGVDGAIHRVGGPAILAECRKVVATQGPCQPGSAVITSAGDLPARYVIHTVGPIWDHYPPERADSILGSSYSDSLALAEANACATVAFPNISTGVYGFPKDRAAEVAIRAVRAYVGRTPTPAFSEITFVCFDQGNLGLYQHLLG